MLLKFLPVERISNMCFDKEKRTHMPLKNCQFEFSKNTVFPLLQVAASNYFNNILAQNSPSKNCVLFRLLFEGSYYSRAASNNGNMVVIFDKLRFESVEFSK